MQYYARRVNYPAQTGHLPRRAGGYHLVSYLLQQVLALHHFSTSYQARAPALQRPPDLAQHPVAPIAIEQRGHAGVGEDLVYSRQAAK